MRSRDARFGAARRAAPRLTYIAGLVVALLWMGNERTSGNLSAFLEGGASVAMVVAVGRCLNPAWVKYVRTGEEPPGWLASEPDGEWDVVLDAHGRRPVEIMRVVRQAKGGPFGPILDAVEGAPSTVASGVCGPAADRLVAALLTAGASAHRQPAR